MRLYFSIPEGLEKGRTIMASKLLFEKLLEEEDDDILLYYMFRIKHGGVLILYLKRGARKDFLVY